MKRICLLGSGLFVVYVATMSYLFINPKPANRWLSVPAPISKLCLFNDPLDTNTWLRIKWERLLKDKNPKVRKQAAEELGKLGYHAEPAVPSLLDALNDDDWDVVGAAAEAIPKIDLMAARNAGLAN